MAKKRIGELLLEQGYVTKTQLNIALLAQKVTNKQLGDILQSYDFITVQDVAEAIAIQNGTKAVDINSLNVSKEALSLIPKHICESKNILPISLKDDRLVVAIEDPSDLITYDFLKNYTKKEIIFVVTDKVSISKAIALYYYQLENPVEKELESLIEDIKSDKNIDVVKLVEVMINYGIKEKASDIHITPDEIGLHLFFRLDGVLQHYSVLPIKIQKQLVSRIKILSQLDIAEQRLPQDGSYTHTFLGENFDVRVSTLPTNHGENIVIRVLSKKVALHSLKSLGFGKKNRKKLESYFKKPYGIVLVTGPTGSGKTTTLYAALRNINSLESNILTIEDPIEHKFAFIKQTQVNEKAGYTFSNAIRHFMRQDPDVILIGEIRDKETAELAIRASITGHMVFSTLHTNDAIGAIPRLKNLGVDGYMIGSALLGVIAQRLVRKLCPHCRKKVELKKEDIEPYFGDCMLYDRVTNSKVVVYEPVGCEVCRGIGYIGRQAIIEILEINSEIERMIMQDASLTDIEEVSKKYDMRKLKDDAMLKVFRGTTSIAEVQRVVL